MQAKGFVSGWLPCALLPGWPPSYERGAQVTVDPLRDDEMIGGNRKRSIDCPFAEHQATLLHNARIGIGERFSVCRLDLGTRHSVYSGG